MRHLTAAFTIILALSAGAFAQNSGSERAGMLRQQLAENESKQAALKSRLQEIDEQIKPENIEKNLAGVGSTKPEDLREQKRKQLETERRGVQTQLDLLATSRTRLETSLAQADADAYRESAGVGPSGTVITSPPTSNTTPASVKPSTTPTINRTPSRRIRRGKSRPRRVSRLTGESPPVEAGTILKGTEVGAL
jgi:hypothetical protein